MGAGLGSMFLPTADMSEKVFIESSSDARLPVTNADAHWPMRHGVFGITLICTQMWKSEETMDERNSSEFVDGTAIPWGH